MTARPLRTLLAAVVGVLALAVAAAPAATAATYPPAPNAITVPSTGVVPGATVTVSACCFEPGSVVVFTIGTPLASLGSSRGGASLADAALVNAAEGDVCTSGSTCEATAGDDGSASVEVEFSQAGKHSITATGTGIDGEPLTVTSTVNVAADDDGDAPGDDEGNDPDASGGLANTGSDVITYGLIGLALVAAGSVLVVALRRRSPSRHTA